MPERFHCFTRIFGIHHTCISMRASSCESGLIHAHARRRRRSVSASRTRARRRCPFAFDRVGCPVGVPRELSYSRCSFFLSLSFSPATSSGEDDRRCAYNPLAVRRRVRARNRSRTNILLPRSKKNARRNNSLSPRGYAATVFTLRIASFSFGK